MSLNDEFWERVSSLIVAHGRDAQVDDADFEEFVRTYRSPSQALSFELGLGRDVLVVNDNRMAFVSEYPLTFGLGLDFEFVAGNHARSVFEHYCGEERLRIWRSNLL